MITLYTIGFTKKSAEQFFELLKQNKVKMLVDVRISNGSQLAGFAKGNDLKYFVRAICNIDYKHITDFAPTKELLSKWRKEEVNWKQYTEIYTGLLKSRDIIKKYILEKYNNRPDVTEDDIEECFKDIEALKADGRLFSKDSFDDEIRGFAKDNPNVRLISLNEL